MRNKHQNCARLFHIPTGLKQERQGRSRDANYRDAMAALIAMLDERLRLGSKAVEDDVRRQQIGSGMRGDKRRTITSKMTLLSIMSLGSRYSSQGYEGSNQHIAEVT
ncbi:peptide chain release factor-like protein [Agrobacterium rubi]|nr:peptide chain release factor-like protein [Agrobacterium rubi]NTF24100.1 peptide chain release factor-like protein [Agrobacterium rubi]